jgi:hypothetical protein
LFAFRNAGVSMNFEILLIMILIEPLINSTISHWIYGESGYIDSSLNNETTVVSSVQYDTAYNDTVIIAHCQAFKI